MSYLFDCAIDYAKDVFRNIRSIKISQDLFDDLSDDPLNWEAANALDIETHPPLVTTSPLIQRAFDYSKNDFIDYPFENITISRYSDGSFPCWYGSETLETTIFETKHHFMQEILNGWEVFQNQKSVRVDRRVAQIHCQGLGFDLSAKIAEFPWLVESSDYARCQEIGKRIATEGHPLLITPSARHQQGVNLVAFKPDCLSRARDFCKLHYVFDLEDKSLKVFRGEEELEMIFAQISHLQN